MFLKLDYLKVDVSHKLEVGLALRFGNKVRSELRMSMSEVSHVTDDSDVLNVTVNNDMKKLEKSSSSFRAHYHRARAELELKFFELFLIRAFFEPKNYEPTSSRAFPELLAYSVPSPSRAEL